RIGRLLYDLAAAPGPASWRSSGLSPVTAVISFPVRKTTMRIAYLTTDEVNLDQARHLAKAQRITLCHLTPGEATPGDLFDAVLFDRDYWPMESRAETLATLVAGCGNCPVALHSYNVDQAEEEALRDEGVAVHRMLDADVLASLRRAVIDLRVAASGR